MIECQTDAGLPACNLGTLRIATIPVEGCKSYPFQNTRIFVLSVCRGDVGSRGSNHSYRSSGKNGKNIIFCTSNLTRSATVSYTATLLSNVAVAAFTAQRTQSHRFLFNG
ncbi:unnamed protein product [Macrosiphum euphorbiae]|uniref:Uncharacterized protein n=1 Tax=Macrosiphum euphorbiae TaxID=13131 RepID=A0AAV0VH30_9HEMI|nr:unnamed protein product [Macrosiphum euphorbiae]